MPSSANIWRIRSTQFINSECHVADGLNILLSSGTDSNGMIGIDQRIAQSIIFIREFQNGAFQLGAFLQSQTLCHGTGRLITDDNLQRNNLDLLDNGLSVTDFLYKIGLDTLTLQQLEHEIGHSVVDNTLTGDGTLFQAIESGSVILILYQTITRLRHCINLLCFSLVQKFCLFHCELLLSQLKNYQKSISEALPTAKADTLLSDLTGRITTFAPLSKEALKTPFIIHLVTVFSKSIDTLFYFFDI